MSHDAGDVVLHLGSYVGKVLPVRGTLYVVGDGTMYLAGSESHWRQGQVIRLDDERAGDGAATIMRFVPPHGGGTAGWILDATARGRITQTGEPGSAASICDIEEVDLRDEYLTARMRLRDAF
ncbi:MAG TPA: hypothetical protein VGI81_05315 [Tepidisphaeraceae bacterium]|jgi:hypothetical protein